MSLVSKLKPTTLTRLRAVQVTPIVVQIPADLMDRARLYARDRGVTVEEVILGAVETTLTPTPSFTAEL